MFIVRVCFPQSVWRFLEEDKKCNNIYTKESLKLRRRHCILLTFNTTTTSPQSPTTPRDWPFDSAEKSIQKSERESVKLLIDGNGLPKMAETVSTLPRIAF